MKTKNTMVLPTLEELYIQQLNELGWKDIKRGARSAALGAAIGAAGLGGYTGQAKAAKPKPAVQQVQKQQNQMQDEYGHADVADFLYDAEKILGVPQDEIIHHISKNPIKDPKTKKVIKGHYYFGPFNISVAGGRDIYTMNIHNLKIYAKKRISKGGNVDEKKMKWLFSRKIPIEGDKDALYVFNQLQGWALYVGLDLWNVKPVLEKVNGKYYAKLERVGK